MSGMRQSGGAEGNRTPDLVIANDALSQLSYGPIRAALMGDGPRLVKRGTGAVGAAFASAMSKSIFWKARQFTRRLWVRASLVSLLAILAALLAPLSNYLPYSFEANIERATLEGLLGILTNSMLTVTTFSLSIMVAAHLSADTSATPRAHRLLQQDSRTQTVLATFIGAFIYALALTIMLNTGFIAEGELAIVYLFTVAVILFVVLAILRWVGHLDGLGSVEATIRRSAERAAEEVAARANAPFLGARPYAEGGEVPKKTRAVTSARSGYVQNVDVRALSKALGGEGRVWIEVVAGDWVVAGETLVRVSPPDRAEGNEKAFHAAFTFNDRREHGQDTIYSLVVLTEIAEKALSPGINDPRTALDVIGRITRLVLDLPPERPLADPAVRDVFVRPLDRAEMIRTCLDPISRDGRSFQEIAIMIQRAAGVLSRHPDAATAEAARALSSRGLSYARDGILIAADLERIGSAAVAGGPAPVTDGALPEPAAEALGEEDASSRFRERS